MKIAASNAMIMMIFLMSGAFEPTEVAVGCALEVPGVEEGLLAPPDPPAFSLGVAVAGDDVRSVFAAEDDGFELPFSISCLLLVAFSKSAVMESASRYRNAGVGCVALRMILSNAGLQSTSDAAGE